jgi:hypothetical protein
MPQVTTEQIELVMAERRGFRLEIGRDESWVYLLVRVAQGVQLRFEPISGRM